MTMLCPSCWGGARQASCIYCGGDGRVDDVQVSPHFRLSELVRSSRALRLGIPNAPTPEIVRALTRTCLALGEPVRDRWGPQLVTSAYRSPRLNGETPGSSSTSAHPHGWALDIVPIRRTVSLRQIVDWVIASDLAFDQVIYEGTWVHLGLYRPSDMAQRRQALMAFPGPGGRLVYEPYNPRDRRVA